MFMLSNFFLFYFILVFVCSIFVILSRNPVQSVYFLILVFSFSSVLFIILGAEFLAVLVIIIYVGAISILFLFVVMMLNLRIIELYSTFYNYLPIGGFIGLFLFLVFTFGVGLDFGFFKYNDLNYINYTLWDAQFFSYQGNVEYIGWTLYTYYYYYVIIAGLLLLVSMLGSIILTVDFEYRSFLNKDSYGYVLRDISTVSFWNSTETLS